MADPAMLIEIELVHADAGQRVVRARAIAAEGCLAMALGEAATAEEAEDKARTRLAAQLEAQTGQPPQHSNPPQRNSQPQRSSQPQRDKQFQPSSEPQSSTANESSPGEQPLASPPGPPAPAEQEPQADPEDWSSELASLDLQLQRLGWSREQESTYLARAFGHGSRSRLTTYADLVTYLKALEAMPSGAEPGSAAVPLKRSDLLSQCDLMLRQLGWDAARGRQLLETQFGRSSRQQLSDSQLLEFNMVLEGELISSTQILEPDRGCAAPTGWNPGLNAVDSGSPA